MTIQPSRHGDFTMENGDLNMNMIVFDSGVGMRI
jgi:hypothetical protein